MTIYTVLNENFVIKSYQVELPSEYELIYEGIRIETDLDLEQVWIIDNYKFVNGELIELTEEEKENLIKPTEPNKMEVLGKKVAELEEENKLLQKENKLLHAQVEVLGATTDFHEELITEMAMKVYA